MTALFCTPTQDYYSSHIRLIDSFFALCGVIKKEIKFERFCKCTIWKKKPLPKIGLLVQIGGETWLPLYYDESVQIFLKLDWIVTVTIHVYFRRTYMESSENNATYISPPICTNRLISDQEETFYLVLSGYANLSHDFSKFSFRDIVTSLLYTPTTSVFEAKLECLLN